MQPAPSSATPSAPSADATPGLILSVGVLLPTDLRHPEAGANLLDGLRLSFAGTARLRAVIRHAEAGLTAAEVLEAAVGLIDGGAHVLVADVDLPLAELLAPLCRERAVALVVSGVGAHRVRQAMPGVLHCNQQLWEASYFMGGWSARHLGADLFQVVAVPDADDAPVALREGFLAAGGRAAGMAITHARAAGNDDLETARAARTSGAGTIAIHASGYRAVEIVRAMRAAGIEGDLVVDGLAAEDFALTDLGRGSGGIYSASSWCRSDSTAFADRFRLVSGRAADPYAAVGHDAAALIAEGARRLTRQGDGWAALAEAVGGLTVQGSRGLMTVDPVSLSTTTPVLVRRVRAGRNTVVARRAVAPVTELAAARATYVAELAHA